MSYQINLCIYFKNEHNISLVSNVLLSIGIAPHVASNEEELFSIIEEKKIDFLFIDFDNQEEHCYDILTKIKDKDHSLFIIATSYNSNQSFINRLKNFNILLFFIKPLTQDMIKEKFTLVLKKYSDHFPDRQHVRIRPDYNELIRIAFKLKKSGKRISGKVIDVSLIGLGAQLYSDYNGAELEKGSFIEHLFFETNNREIDVDAVVVHKKGKFFSVRFTHYYEDSYELLMRYITKKLASS